MKKNVKKKWKEKKAKKNCKKKSEEKVKASEACDCACDVSRFKSRKKSDDATVEIVVPICVALVLLIGAVAWRVKKTKHRAISKAKSHRRISMPWFTGGYATPRSTGSTLTAAHAVKERIDREDASA